jgi:hypothetical protein
MKHLNRLWLGLLSVAFIVVASALMVISGNVVAWLIDHWQYGKWIFAAGGIILLVYMVGVLAEAFLDI